MHIWHRTENNLTNMEKKISRANFASKNWNPQLSCAITFMKVYIRLSDAKGRKEDLLQFYQQHMLYIEEYPEVLE